MLSVLIVQVFFKKLQRYCDISKLTISMEKSNDFSNKTKKECYKKIQVLKKSIYFTKAAFLRCDSTLTAKLRVKK